MILALDAVDESARNAAQENMQIAVVQSLCCCPAVVR